MSKRRTGLALVLVVGVATLSRPAGAFKEHWHKAITYTALSFLNDDVLRQMLAVHDELDKPIHLKTAGVDKWHFNDCDFRGATDNIRTLYDAATGNGKRARPEVDWVSFGRLLHTVQDFYAHSNWVDLGETSLVNTRLDEWPIISPYQVVTPDGAVGGDIVAVAGKQCGWSVSRRRGERKVVVTRPDGTKARGLISGSAYLKKQCPNEIAIGHWDEPAEQLGLAKDYPCRGDSFYPACSLALRQTLHEWCRLLALEEKYYGKAGRDAVLSKMKNEDARKEAEKICQAQDYRRPDFAGGCSCGR